MCPLPVSRVPCFPGLQEVLFIPWCYLRGVIQHLEFASDRLIRILHLSMAKFDDKARKKALKLVGRLRVVHDECHTMVARGNTKVHRDGASFDRILDNSPQTCSSNPGQQPTDGHV